jgi:hypothetical protein
VIAAYVEDWSVQEFAAVPLVYAVRVITFEDAVAEYSQCALSAVAREFIVMVDVSNLSQSVPSV